MERSGKFTANAWRVAALLIVICLAAPLAGLQAQPNLTFKRVSVNWPTIELYFSVGCGGNPAYNMSNQDFRIFENGVEVKGFTLSCPDPATPCPISVSLVLDASGSMMGTGNAGAKQAGHAFVDLMDGQIDEASVIWFTSVVTIFQQMTTIKPLLHSGVDALPANGATAVWDGGYAGLIELINNGVNQCRAVVLLTDGGDNSSSRTPAEIIALANRHRIRVFTVALGSSVNSMELDLIAQLTGGKYFQTPNVSQLPAIYQEIFTLLRQGFQECVITYQRNCADGGLRTVDLQLKDFCGGNDTKTKTYRAPLDSSTYSNLHMEIGDASGKSDADITVPMNLLTPINGEMFYPINFTLEYDTSCVRLQNVTAPPGSVLPGVPISVTPVPTGSLIQLGQRTMVNGSGAMLDLVFKASDRKDTCCSEIRVVNPRFEQGCFKPVIDGGKICVSPDVPEVACSMLGPKHLTWERPLNNYVPNPFVITGHVVNSGSLVAKNARYRIIYDATDLRLVSPLTDTQTLSPADITAGTFADVMWQVAAKPRATADSVEVCIVGSFDNHPDVRCCLKVYIPAAGPLLECSLEVPEIIADTANLLYIPMPFKLTATAVNTGGIQTDTVWAAINLPAAFELVAPDAPNRYTKQTLPPILESQWQGRVSWTLRHPHSSTPRDYTITVWTWAANTDSTRCDINVHIPGLPPPGFGIQLAANGPLTFCDGDSVMLDAGTGYINYNWSHGQQTQQIVAKRSGNYYCIVRRADGVFGRSDTVRISVRPAPVPVIVPAGPIEICVGDSATLRVSGNFEEYLWSNGETTPEINVKRDGQYHVRVRDTDNCWGSSTPVTVRVNLKPEKPVIQRTGDLLSVAAGYQCQWFRNGIAITGAIQPALVVTQPGSYQVRYMSSKGCTTVSDPFDVTVLGLTDDPPIAGSSALEAWPEPVGDLLRIRISDVDVQPVTLLLYDIRGRSEVLHSGMLSVDGAEFSYSLRGREAGVYYLVAVLRESVLVKRVTKM